MAIGRVGSYATTEAPKDPLLGTLQNIEQVGFQKRAEDRLIADKKKLEEEKQLAEDVAWDGKFDPTIVGNSKIDDPMLAMSFKAKEEVGQIRRQLKNQSLPYEEKVRLNSRLNKISQSFNVANQTPKIILEKAKEIAKNIDKYDPQSVNIIEGIAKQLETGKYEAYYDENGTARIKIFKTDETGKPIGILKETTIGDLANEFNPRMKSNYSALLNDAVKTTQVKDITTQKGANILQTKGVDPAVAEAKGDVFAKLVMSNPDEVYAAAKRFQIDEKDTEAIYEAVKTDYKNSLDKLVKQDIDSALITEARQARKDAKEEEKTNPVIGTGTITVKEGVVEGTSVVKPKGSRTFAIANAERKLGTGKIEKLKEVVRKNDGNLIFVVQETYDGETVQKKQLSEEGRRKEEYNKKNAKAIKDKKLEEKVIYDDDYETVTTASKRPSVKAYDTGSGDANDAENFAVMLINPKTGEYFSGLNEAIEYFGEKAGKIGTGKKKNSKGSYDDI